jgi:hypothetical protein
MKDKAIRVFAPSRFRDEPATGPLFKVDGAIPNPSGDKAQELEMKPNA